MGSCKEDLKMFREKIEPLEPKVAKICSSYKGCLGVSINEYQLSWEDIRWADKNDPNHPVLKVQELTRKLFELRNRKERELEEEEIFKTNEKKGLNISKCVDWFLQILRIVIQLMATKITI